MSNYDLEEMYRHRAGLSIFKERDLAYRVNEGYYLSRDPTHPGIVQLTWRPYLVDAVDAAGSRDHRIAINHVRRVVNHFQAMFAHPPPLWALAGGKQEEALKRTALLEQWQRRSNLEALQPRQSHWLSLRGDAVYNLDYDPADSERRHDVFFRTYDPAWCYPTHNAHDLGGIDDMLVVVQADPEWVERAFGLRVPRDSHATIFYYWDRHDYQVQVNRIVLGKYGRNHGLGFCPFRWVFGQGDGLMGQADVREVPRLQDLFNENVLLAMDAIRKKVDPAYYGTGLHKNLTPEPGTVVAVPNQEAKISEFPSGVDPQMILGVMGFLDANIQSMTAVSPISMTGQASGSIVTGAAVRHQVEAIEQRAEAKKVQIQAAFAKLGEMALAIGSNKLDGEIEYSTRSGQTGQLEAKEIGRWECVAEYGGFMAVPLESRVRVLLEGLGKFWDEHEAIRQLGLTGVNSEDMVKRLADYQARQAQIAARAQAEAQHASEAAQGGPPPDTSAIGLGGGPGPGHPQRATLPRTPSPAELRSLLAGIKPGGANGARP